MPAIDTVAANRTQRRKKKDPPPAPPRNADTGDTARSRSAPRTPPSTAFKPLGNTQPFHAQQQQARSTTRAAVRHLPKPVIATPPIIQNPTPQQTRAAHAQIVASVRRQLGGTSGAERVARTQALYDQIRTDPRLARTRRSIEHWQRESTKLTRPDATYYPARPGLPDTKRHVGVGGLNLATINTTAASRTLGTLAAKAAPGLMNGTAEAQFARNAFKDVGTLASAPFVAGVQLAGIGKDVVTGHPGQAADRAYQLGKGIVEGTIQDWSHPGKYLVDHPLLFGLDVSGAGSVAGRTAGALGRAGGLRRASVVRPPLAMAEDLGGGIVERRYSKDLIRSMAQQAADSTRERLKDEHGNDVMVDQAGRQVPVLKARDNLVAGIFHPKVGSAGALANKRGDMVAGGGNARERLAREEEGKDRRVRGLSGRDEKNVVAMVARATITSAAYLQQDLTNYVQRVRGYLREHDREAALKANDPNHEYKGPYLHEGEVERARKNVELAEKILRSPKAMAQAERIVQEGERHGAALVQHDAAAVEAGLFQGGAEQARRARLVEVATQHMGGFHGTDPRIDARVEAMRRNERSLQARLNFGHVTQAQRAQIAQQLQSSRATRRALAENNTERLRDAHGNPLEPKQIEDFLRSRGRDPETVAYLPANVTRKQFHQQLRPDSRGMLDKPGHVRTGAQAAKGAVENSVDILKAAGVRHVTTITKARNIDRFIADHGMIHPAMAKAKAGQVLTKHERRVVAKGGYFNGPEAAEVIQRAKARGENLVAVRAFPGRLDAETQKMIREDLQGPGAMDGLGQRLLSDRFLKDEDYNSRTRNLVLMNEALVMRLQAHLKPSTSAGKFAQIANRAFRYAVLPQPRWVTGNFFEPLFVRLPGVGSGVNVFGLAADFTAGVRQIRHMERSGNPAMRRAAQEIRAQQFGGLLFGNRGLTNRRTLEDFPALDRATQKVYGKMVSKLPASRQMAQMTGWLLKNGGKAALKPLDLIFNANRIGEAGLQRVAFGKSVRQEAQAFGHQWINTIKLGQRAMDDVAKGLVNTPSQERFLRAQHELLGKYSDFGPTMRGVVQGVAPFLPYMLNAARFVFWTMPAHRSAQTALLVRLNDVVNKDWQELHQDVPPGMGLAIPTKDGGWIDIARYTPYGVTSQFARGDFRGLTSNLLPQLSGTQEALEGKDPFGRDLRFSNTDEPTGWQNVGVAVNSALEAFTPYLSTARRLSEHGETAFADSRFLHPRTMEGTSHGMSAATRTLSPIRPTYVGDSGGSGSGTANVEPPKRAPSAPQTPREAMLERRRERLAARAQQDGRRNAMLERRRERLAARGR